MNKFNTMDTFSPLISGLEIPLAIFDSEGLLFFCSESMTDMLGFTPSSLIGLVEGISSLPAERVKLTDHFNMISNMISDGSSFSATIKRDRGNGSSKVFEIRAAMYSKRDRAEIAVQLIDTSREANLFSEIESLERLASAGRMAAGVAHEFNNLLTAMLGWSQLAMKAAEGNESAVSALKTIDNNTRRAKQIAGELLDISRPKAVTETVFSVATAVEDALRLLSWELNAAKISVERAAQDTAYCLGDSTRMVQVFINIVRNAIEATPSNGSLRVSQERTEENVKVSFTDSGNGIPNDVLDKIFEPFFSTKIRSAGTGGSGLGLAICRKIVQDHGGDIVVHSRRPGGTTVSVTLPVSGEIETVVPETNETRSSFPPGISVLVVDDEPDICEMIRTALTIRGAYVVVAANGNEAVNICKTDQFDAAFVDFSMNGLSGHDLGKAIAEVQPNLSIVFMSGVQIPNDDNPNYTDFLKKPFDLHEIQVKLREVLDAD